LSISAENDFSFDSATGAGFTGADFSQQGLSIHFTVNQVPFTLHSVGQHNMENALAAATVAAQVGVDLSTSAEAIATYEGIYRRHQVIGKKNGVILIDDYAHNPVKCAASIRACQPVGDKLIAWFQPHGYAPTKFLRKDFCEEISAAMRPQDQIWMSEIFYAGGTTTKDISAADLIQDLKENGINAHFVEHRDDLVSAIRKDLDGDVVLLLMGARDPSLEHFAAKVWKQLG
jgi:UDP-N-acetylmuramate--alanine ligase